MPNLEGEFNLKQKEIKETESSSEEPKALDKNRSPHFYSSFWHFPRGVLLQDQAENEEIVLLIRRHFITNLPWILGAILLSLIPPLTLVFLPIFFPFINISLLSQFVSIAFFYVILFGFILVNFSVWYFNVGLITNIRVIDLDVSGVLYRHLSETRLNIIEDVTFAQVGTIRSLFNYGDVFVQTAGETKNFEFDRAPNPARIVRLIADMIGGER